MPTAHDPYVRTKRAIQAAKKKPAVVPWVDHLKRLAANPKQFAKGLAALRQVLLRSRWDNQGGFPSYNKIPSKGSHWSFHTASIGGQATPEEHDAILAFAGITPDEIAEDDKRGCKTCGNAKVLDYERFERGYEGPCLFCKRPLMSHWVPVGKLIKRKDGKPWLPEGER